MSLGGALGSAVAFPSGEESETTPGTSAVGRAMVPDGGSLLATLVSGMESGIK